MFGVAQRQLLPCVQGISSHKIHLDCVCVPSAHLQGVAPTLLPWFPSCAEAVKLGLPQGGCSAGRWAQNGAQAWPCPCATFSSLLFPPPQILLLLLRGCLVLDQLLHGDLMAAAPVGVLRASHSQWHPEPSPHVGDGRTWLVLGRSLEITLRAFPECSELSTSAV